ncbi:MAG TPA: VanW family protein [Pyrinomonadaceae bacterium]|nr:VanW family protein [Pyrinomonadaceae bacterium]
MRFSEIHPIVYHTRVFQLRMMRRIRDARSRIRFADEQTTEQLPYTVYNHQSLLRRKLGSLDMKFQENKVTNLELARQPIDGLLIKPDETFSFWNRIGQTTAAKGYLEGLQLSRGEIKTAIGGGLCQLANLLLWMAFHSPLTIAERHHHSFDPFPDDRRALPFGSGASVFYNYIDLRFHNPTGNTFQFRVRLTDEHLKGSLLSKDETPTTYHVVERDHRFLEKNGKNYRQNEIWREVIDRRTGNAIDEELLVKNFAEVKYELNFPVGQC